ncbi:MAG: AAA family ATPase, partial [Lentisphaerae bacterium]|nr:AAA family ATPase [Lentisphaerota bacterium]
RLIVNYQARIDRVDASTLVRRLLAAVDEAGIRLPEGVQIGAR